MIRSALRRNRVTLLLLLAQIALSTSVISSRTHSPLVTALATGYSPVVVMGHWWTVITASLFAESWPQLLIGALATATLLGVSERLLGAWRTTLALVVCGGGGVVIGIVIQSIGVEAGELWSVSVAHMLTLDPTTPAFGCLMVASAFTGRLWRRRIRVLAVSAALVLVLYSGQPSDLYRVIASVVGLVLGWALRPWDRSPSWQRSSHHETRVLVAAVIALSAIGPVISVFNRVRLGPLAPLALMFADESAGSTRTVDRCAATWMAHGCLRADTLERISGVGPIVLTVMPLVAMLVAALGVYLGRRFGAWLAIVVNIALSALAVLYYGLVPLFPRAAFGALPRLAAWETPLDLSICTFVPITVAAIVFANIRHFTVHASPGLVRTYLVTVLSSLAAAASLYVVVGWMLRAQFFPEVQLSDLLADLPDRFAPVGFLKLERLTFHPTGPGALALYQWVGPAFWLVVILGALVVIVRPLSVGAAGRAHALSILRTAGGGSFSYWTTWQGNRYWTSSDGLVSVAYRVANGVAVTTSEPVGEIDAAKSAMSEFARYCDDSGWTPFFYGIHAEFAGACLEMGWAADIIGDETIVYPAEWTTSGKQGQDVRTSLNRAQREELRVEWTRFSELNAKHTIELQEISELWVAEKGLPEMGFTLGGLDELRDDEVRLMLALDSQDQVIGITSWLPTYRLGRVVGWTLDFMRRTPDGPNGVMEFLIARSVEQFRTDDIEFMSLSTAPLAGNTAAASNTSIDRMLRYIGNLLEPVYGFRSLFNFKRKFQPEFRPIYMAYPDSASLPSIALALARIYVPSMSLREAIRFVRSLNRAR